MLDVYETLKFDNPDGGAWKQGWNITYDRVRVESRKPKLQIFVVPHSHCDPGWIKTFETYHLDQTRHILDNMVQKLSSEPRMKFIFAEISFFERWWRDAGESKRSSVKKLLENGQLEIVSGAWVMTDEANSHFYATVDQLIEGNQWLYNHLDFVPKYHWSIDPFGLTPTMAYLMKSADFSAMVVQRVHYSVKKYLARQKNLEFYWRQLWSSKSQSDMLCHLFPFYSYDVPHTCGPEPEICCQFDFKRLPSGGVSCPWNVPPTAITDANVREKASTLLDQYRKKAELYKTNALLVPLGDDFRFDTETEWDRQFVNYQRLFNYMNGRPEWNVEAKFGTLSDYFNALAAETNETAFPTLTGDFFTYADRDDHYWSGYFTSRPFYKRVDRVLQRFVRGAEIVFSIARRLVDSRDPSSTHFAADRLFSMLVNARRNMALFQHHDGVTGTAKDHVMVDYGQRMHQSIEDCRTIMADSIRLILTADGDQFKSDLISPTLKFTDRMANFDSLPENLVLLEDNSQQKIVAYNSLAVDRDDFVCVHSSPGRFAVREVENNRSMPIQVNPVIFKDRDRFEISTTICEVCWYVSLPAMGLKLYALSKEADRDDRAEVVTNFDYSSKLFDVKKFEGDSIRIQTAVLNASFSTSSGYLRTLSDQNGRDVGVRLNFAKYGTTNKPDKSGAYLFLPDGPAAELPSTANKVLLIRGQLFSKIVVATPLIQHSVTMCNFKALGCQSLKINNLVDIKSESNFELVMRIDSDVQNDDRTFYTDLNGFQIIKRKYFEKIPMQGNVYPMPTASFIEDASTRLSVLNAQPNGVASPQQGSLEVFLDRRLMQDDNRGLGQAVVDNKVTPNSFRLALESMSPPAALDTEKKMGFHTTLGHFSSLILLHPPFILYEKSSDPPSAEYVPARRLCAASLPCDYHLLNLRTMEQPQDYNKTDSSATAYGYPAVKPRKEMALLLHRTAFDCRSAAPVFVSCSVGRHERIRIAQLLDIARVNDVAEMNLNLIRSKRRLLRVSNFSAWLEPMEIGAYQIT